MSGQMGFVLLAYAVAGAIFLGLSLWVGIDYYLLDKKLRYGGSGSGNVGPASFGSDDSD